MSAKTKPDTFFGLSLQGQLPTILRQIAERIEAGTVKVQSVQSVTTEDHVDISMRIELNAK